MLFSLSGKTVLPILGQASRFNHSNDCLISGGGISSPAQQGIGWL